MKKKILILSLFLVLSLLFIIACSPSPKVKVSIYAATVPATTVGSGESTIIFRFVVAATEDTEIEKLVLEAYSDDGVVVEELGWYDESKKTNFATASYQSSVDQKILVWPIMQKINVPAKTTNTFSIRGKVTGQGYLSIRLVGMEVKNGEIEGLPSATITHEVK